MFWGVLSAEAQPPLDGAFPDHSDARRIRRRGACPGRSSAGPPGRAAGIAAGPIGSGPRRAGWRVGPAGLLGEGKTEETIEASRLGAVFPAATKLPSGASLLASVGSTEASNSRLARVGRIDRSQLNCFGVVGPTRATRLSIRRLARSPTEKGFCSLVQQCATCRILYPQGRGRARPHPRPRRPCGYKAEDEAASRWADFASAYGD
jgi:hypothetical protein